MDETIELTLTDIASGGYAIGRQNKKTLFVPFAIPGEEVEVKITDDRGSYAFTSGVKVLAPSADRVLPRCSHFAACNGCQWQHIDYRVQPALKTDIIIDQLARVGGFDMENDEVAVQVTIPAPQPWYYNHQMTFYPSKDGQVRLKNFDNQLMEIEECHLITPTLFALIPRLEFDLDTLTSIQLRDNGAGDLMVILSTSDDSPPHLELDMKVSVNFLLQDNEPANLIGNTYLKYKILDRHYRVTAGTFFRGNLPQIETLVKIIRRELTGYDTILDLYGGAGVFSGVLAPQAKLITYVDSYPPAATDAEENLAEFDHVDIIEGNVADVLESLDESYQAAIVDPLSSGLQKDVLDLLGKLSLKKLVYIADDPATLARDAKSLVKRQGYTLSNVQPIDFEPQTYRTVCVATFTQKP